MSDQENDEAEYEPSWYPYESGTTVGELGPERGIVLRDEELGDPDDDEDADARVTLEQERAENPRYFVTATLYGWLLLTHRAPDEAAAVMAYEAMKLELVTLADLIPDESARKMDEKITRLNEAIATFEQRFAG